MTPTKRRLDLLLVERGLCESREAAARLILAGKVRAAGQPVTKAGSLVPEAVALEVVGPAHPYASRGGLKLAHALAAFGVQAEGRICLDVGASTGGFTDCLLQAGASRVIAVDVGYGQLHARLRADPRVNLLERTNIRHLVRDALPAHPVLAAVDVSFISLGLVLPVVAGLLIRPCDIVALIKPQFEVGRGQVGKRGVVRDRSLHRAVLERIAALGPELGLAVAGMTASPLLGPMGNREFLIHFRSGGPGPDIPVLVEAALGTPPGGGGP
ncbi:MAG TPA: TlyA family RNA methyltransferase [Candidatus Sulfotelmatobacter sp.]|nr:TlyA family RNA methyltransferase [Candidatus Sulfotelmatobacter sp.]